MLWTTTTWNAAYGKSVASGPLTEALQDAEAVVEDRVSADAWEDANATVPTDTNAYRIIRKAVGDLTAVYLQQKNLMPPVADSYSEGYAGVVTYSLSSKSGIGTTMSEAAILARLSPYEDEDDSAASNFSAAVSWGSNRAVGVITVDDDDEVV